MDFHLSIAARTIWQEARGEPADGQQAVAGVILNRLKSKQWGLSLGEVCLSEYHGIYQFSGWGRNDPNRIAALRLDDSNPLLVHFAGLLADLMHGTLPDVTGGATHYFAKSIPAPPWILGDKARGVASPFFCGRFGNQLFYKFQEVLSA